MNLIGCLSKYFNLTRFRKLWSNLDAIIRLYGKIPESKSSSRADSFARLIF